MKKILAATILAIGLVSAGFVYAHGGGGYGGDYGMMGDGGYGMGPGMMSSDGNSGYGCPGAVRFGQNGSNSQNNQQYVSGHHSTAQENK